MVSQQTVVYIKKVLRQLLKLKKRESQLVKAAVCYEEEMMENAVNEALEARLALVLATAPPAAGQTELDFYLMADNQSSSTSSVRVYTGCQRAGPQVAAG